MTRTAGVALDRMDAVAEIAGLARAGRTAEALDQLRSACAGRMEAGDLVQAAEAFLHLSQPGEAAALYRRAQGLRPGDTGIAYNLATALIATGDLAEAETLLDDVIRRNPLDFDAWQNRAGLRTWTTSDNHIAELEAMIDGPGRGRGEVALGYALAKELEDIGDWSRAFAYLKRGADGRRSGLSYDVAGDIAAMTEISRVFDEDYLSAGRGGWSDAAPIFVLGLPRSGTTLVDRIVSSHDSVKSLGEINDLAYGVTRLAGQVAGDKAGLIQAARSIDPARLGREYVTAAKGYGVQRLHFIDKTPANYLYIGLIAKALPNARIVHLSRHPMDSLYALYKTLFRMGCPYSYSLDDLGRYYVTYRGLMRHWQDLLGERIVEVQYEDLVGDPDTQIRRLIAALGLDWQAACLNFHDNRAAVATASAAQVRQPIHTRSVALWRRYEAELAPLAEFLTRAGIAL